MGPHQGSGKKFVKSTRKDNVGGGWNRIGEQQARGKRELKQLNDTRLKDYNRSSRCLAQHLLALNRRLEDVGVW